MAVTAQRTMLDFAEQMRGLVDVRYPEAEVIRVVLDHLNTHKPAALYEAFAPAEARRILKKLEFHYTPKHGSWLNMAEIERLPVGPAPRCPVCRQSHPGAWGCGTQSPGGLCDPHSLAPSGPHHSSTLWGL
jgi:hypothetical protein